MSRSKCRSFVDTVFVPFLTNPAGLSGFLLQSADILGYPPASLSPPPSAAERARLAVRAWPLPSSEKPNDPPGKPAGFLQKKTKIRVHFLDVDKLNTPVLIPFLLPLFTVLPVISTPARCFSSDGQQARRALPGRRGRKRTRPCCPSASGRPAKSGTGGRWRIPPQCFGL